MEGKMGTPKMLGYDEGTCTIRKVRETREKNGHSRIFSEKKQEDKATKQPTRAKSKRITRDITTWRNSPSLFGTGERRKEEKYKGGENFGWKQSK